MEEKTSHKTKNEKESGKSTRKKLRRQKISCELDVSVNESDQLHSEDYGAPKKLEHDTENVSSVKAKMSGLSKSKKRKIGMVSNARGDTEMSNIKRSGKGKKVKKKLKKDLDNKIEINKDDDAYQISSGDTDNVSSGKAKKSALSKTKKRKIGMVSNAGGDTERNKIKRSGKGKKVKKLKKGVDNKIAINKDDDAYQISLGDEDSSKGMMRGDTKTSEIERSGKGKKVKKKLKKDVDNKVEINEDDDVCQISSGDEDSSKGMMKWLSEYHQCRPGVQILQQRIDDYIMAYDEKEEQERKKREAEAAEGGWTVVVHHKGRKKTTDAESGVTVGAVSQASVIDKMEKKKDKIASDFYNFQRREAKRNELLMLQNKFEEDKKRIQQLRAARKFKPY